MFNMTNYKTVNKFESLRRIDMAQATETRLIPLALAIFWQRSLHQLDRNCVATQSFILVKSSFSLTGISIVSCKIVIIPIMPSDNSRKKI